ncbi:hypothetical protein B0H13DRAFT_774421 [Mycena leptocephala]|nr:hypothetical protein B0H13DRAFT_774421 [Mycena leptocephala]
MRSSSVSGNSKRPPDNSEAFHSESEPQTQAGSSHHRPRYMSATLPPYYPQSSFYSHPPYPPPTGVHPVIPLQDPRAQFIISQAMQQLSALFTAPWAAQPLHLLDVRLQLAQRRPPGPLCTHTRPPRITHMDIRMFLIQARLWTVYRRSLRLDPRRLRHHPYMVPFGGRRWSPEVGLAAGV